MRTLNLLLIRDINILFNSSFKKLMKNKIKVNKIIKVNYIDNNIENNFF